MTRPLAVTEVRNKAKLKYGDSVTKGSQVGKTSWRRLPGEKPNWLRPSVPLMYEEAQGRESHLKSRVAMLGETFRPIQQRKTGGAILVVLLPSTGER